MGALGKCKQCHTIADGRWEGGPTIDGTVWRCNRCNTVTTEAEIRYHLDPMLDALQTIVTAQSDIQRAITTLMGLLWPEDTRDG